MIWYALTGALASCETPVGNADVHEALNDATRAYAAFDEAGFLAKVDAINADLACMDEIVAPTYASALHRLRGLRSFLEKDYGVAELHFAAARRIDPTYRFPDSIAPTGNPLHKRYGAVDIGDLNDRRVVPEPARGSYRLDGLRTPKREFGAPVLLQRIAPSGAVSSTAFIEADTPLPDPGERIRERRPAPALLIAGVSCLAASTASLGAAWASKSSFNAAAATREPDAIRSAYRRNLTWNVAAGAFASGGVGLVTAHFVVSERRKRP